jgi:fructose-1-phosphate kinase PfkB-like protein
MKKLTILELAPCADSIYHVSRDADDGYIEGNGRTVTLRSGNKLRPSLVTTYAGGKATNVSRVIDKLLNATDEVDVELIVFRPDSPEGQYIHALQTRDLTRTRIRPVLIEGLARFCIEVIDPTTEPSERVEFNISPRPVWKGTAVDVVMSVVRGLETDVLLMAGSPPLLEASLSLVADIYAQIIEEVRDRVEVISIDTEKDALTRCLESSIKPDLIKINDAEFRSTDSELWERFPGAVVITDPRGCLVRGPGGGWVRVQGATIRDVYSTIGAGDAVHAGITVARSVWGYDLSKSARYGLAAAAAAVGSSDGTRAIDKAKVDDLFTGMEGEGS